MEENLEEAVCKINDSDKASCREIRININDDSSDNMTIYANYLKLANDIPIKTRNGLIFEAMLSDALKYRELSVGQDETEKLIAIKTLMKTFRVGDEYLMSRLDEILTELAIGRNNVNIVSGYNVVDEMTKRFDELSKQIEAFASKTKINREE